MKMTSLIIAILTAAPLLSLRAAPPATPTSCCAVEPKSSMTPAEFAATMATVDRLEIALGKVAQTNASFAPVKKFGAYMVKSHTQLSDNLQKVAAAEKIPLPTQLDAKHAAILKKLSALHGAAFDKAYIPAMVEGHTKVLAMLKSFCAACQNPAICKFAKQTTPVIAAHLKAAQKVQAQMTKAGLL